MLTTTEFNTIYHTNMTSQYKDFDGVMRLPCKTKIYEAMKSVSEAKNEQNKAISLINSVLSEDSKGKLYFWSDLHFFHNNIIKYSNRPFESKFHMNDIMLANYKNIITEHDVVVFGGDITFAQAQEVSAFLQDLPGHKILVIGNHDIGHSGKFIELHAFEATTLCFDFIYNNQQFFVSHYPISENLFSKHSHMWFNIHGHTHTTIIGKEFPHRFINMCVEHTNYTPKLFQSFLKQNLK